MASDPGRRPEAVAPVEPLDVTGTRTVTIGTIVWAVALAVLLPFYGTLRDHGDLSWLWICLAGVGLGVLGRAYCKRREGQLRSSGTEPGASPLGAAGS